MQLTSLEIKGFKSFGDKMTIHFDKGITGIVGPNGCGKSNVVDSIRWVLGEQKTRALRSDKMENVIFNGTRKRKPTQLAEVSLTFKNTKNLLPTEYTTVTITRRYYRTGDSEYMLNGVVCRLKDITNLFMDTGIASNSYAIIELKMVDDILNDKDGSRRQLFEEAAGISKFKTRKKETLKKLNDTDADLSRVEDLLFEIDKNLRSLERQAKQAKRYYKLKEEYQQLSVKLARKTVTGLRDDLLRQQAGMEGENDKKVSLDKQLREKEAALEHAKAELINKEKLLASRQKTLNAHVGKIRAYESEKKIKNERLRFLNDKSQGLREQLEQDRQSNERAAFSIQSLQGEQQGAENIFNELEAKVQGLKGEYEEQKAKHTGLQEEVNTLSQQTKSKREGLFQLQKSVEIKQIQLSTLKQELEKTATDSTEQTASLAEFDERSSSLKAELDEMRRELQEIQDEDKRIKEEIESTTQAIEEVREERQKLTRKLDARQNEYNLTKSLVDNLEGFPEAIKFLRKKTNWGQDAPLVGDIITCDERHRVMIEGYLEPYMNFYVVDDAAMAYEAVNLLADASRGKANFFLLDSLASYRPSPLKMFANAVPATDIIEYDLRYRPLIAFLFDNVYVVQGDYHEIPDDGEATFITLQGNVTKRRNSISGGSVGLFEGKRIGRAKNLEKLDLEIAEMRQRLKVVEKGLEEKQERLGALKANRKREAIDELQRQIGRTNEEYISIKTKQEQLSLLITSARDKREDIMAKLEELNDSMAEEQPRAEQWRSELEGLEERLEMLAEDLEVQNKLLSAKSAAFNEENILYHQQENRVTSIAQEINFKQTAFDSSKERIEKNNEELKKNEGEIKRLLETAETNDDELVAMYAEKETIEQGVNEAEKSYYGGRGEIDQYDKDARELRNQRQQLDTVTMELQNAMNETRMKMNSVQERLSVEFSLELEAIMEEPPEDDGVDAAEELLRDMVQQVKAKLDKFGPINPMAMEAYEEIKERHTFITNQRDDLVKAKESLLNTIGEIDTVARETFMQAFETIRDNFQKVFRTLFTEEDECELRLIDPEQPLESAIDIMAKPKGKRPLTINQLSGGEKTLTATSLLFAIYLLKPAPFCIFDEVDAPLDDANIDKFNNIIRKFSGESQFIIVTHNKRTMASTDIIYGVTMVEQGVSRVVPVDLRELE